MYIYIYICPEQHQVSSRLPMDTKRAQRNTSGTNVSAKDLTWWLMFAYKMNAIMPTLKNMCVNIESKQNTHTYKPRKAT